MAFFVFAQAAFLRSKGQSAADAAALAAAMEARDQLYGDFLDALDGDGDLEAILTGDDLQVISACEEEVREAAVRLADRNDAHLDSCDVADGGYTVGVVTRDSLGDTVIPGTESQKANEQATAVIRSLCEVDEEDNDQVELTCEDEDWSFDPGDEEELPEAHDLFLVHLED